MERHSFWKLTLLPRHLSRLRAGAWRCQDNVLGGSLLAYNGAAGLLLFSNVGVSGVQNKIYGWMTKIACMNESYKNFRSWIVWMGLFFLEMTLFCRLYYWSIAREEFIRVSHTWESSGESNARKFLNFLNFYPKKPHKWRRFSIFVSAIMICPPHEILLGQDICQLAVAFCLAVSIIVLACLTEQRVHVFFA